MEFYKVLVLVFVCLQSVLAQQSANQDDIFDLGVVKTLKHCMVQQEKMDCLKRKVIEKIDEEIKRNRTIEISDGIVLKRDTSFDENGIASSSRTMKGMSLNEMVFQKINDYFKSLVVQFKVNDNGVEEGRRRKHRYYMQMLMFGAAGIFGILGHLFVGKIALMSGSALMIAKLALLIAVLAGIKKLGHNETKEQHIVYSSGDHGGHHGAWSRSSLAQDIAYRNQRPRPIIEMTPSLAYSVYEDPIKGELDPSGK